MKRQGLVLLAAVSLAAPLAGAAYKCVNEKGRTLIGDTPPEGCEHVEMYEVTSTGHVIRKIDPTPTAEQMKAYAADADKRRAAEKAAAEQKRKDTALLSTYSNEKEIDIARDRNIEPIKIRIKTSQSRIADVDKRIKKIDEEMEFYTSGKSKKKKGGDATPQGLVSDRASAVKEKESLQAGIKEAEKEIDLIRDKYETDKTRFNELKNADAGPR